MAANRQRLSTAVVGPAAHQVMGMARAALSDSQPRLSASHQHHPPVASAGNGLLPSDLCCPHFPSFLPRELINYAVTEMFPQQSWQTAAQAVADDGCDRCHGLSDMVDHARSVVHRRLRPLSRTVDMVDHARSVAHRGVRDDRSADEPETADHPRPARQRWCSVLLR